MNDHFYVLIIISIAGIILIIGGSVLLQVRSQNKLLQQQKQLAAAEILHQKALLAAVITSQETERMRIGNDLHDEVGAALSALRMLIEKHTDNVNADRDFTDRSKSMIDKVVNNVRQIAHNLSPHISGKYGFYDALHGLCDAVNMSGSINAILKFDEEEMPVLLTENTAISLYRVVSELINNTVKHARATFIEIDIAVADNVMQLHYADNGIGFNYNSTPADKGMGMRNIESRLNMIRASMAVQPQAGYSVVITAPLV